MSTVNGPAGITFRLFEPEHDFPVTAELIRDVNGHDNEPWMPTAALLEHDWEPTPGYVGARDTLLAFDGERLVGAANVGWRERGGTIVHNREVWVRPEDRRRGIGTSLLRWTEDHAVESVTGGFGGPPELAHVHNAGTNRDNAAGNAFARAMGYAPIRYGFVMTRDLSAPIPDVPLPDGIEVRTVVEADHRRIWAADVDAFKDHWESAVRDESDYRRFFGAPDLDTSLWQVAWAGGEVAGSVMNFIYPDESRELGIETGWLEHVSTRREYRGRGIASALIARSLVTLRDRGMAVARLGVDGTNPTGALELYKRHGFTELMMWIAQRKPFPAGVGAAARPDALPEEFRAPEAVR